MAESTELDEFKDKVRVEVKKVASSPEVWKKFLDDLGIPHEAGRQRGVIYMLGITCSVPGIPREAERASDIVRVRDAVAMGPFKTLAAAATFARANGYGDIKSYIGFPVEAELAKKLIEEGYITFSDYAHGRAWDEADYCPGGTNYPAITPAQAATAIRSARR